MLLPARDLLSGALSIITLHLFGVWTAFVYTSPCAVAINGEAQSKDMVDRQNRDVRVPGVAKQFRAHGVREDAEGKGGECGER